MKCLIDGDVLVYEVGFASQWVDKDSNELVVRDFEQVAEFLDQRIREIEGECWSDEPSCLYLTVGETTNKVENRWRKTHNLPTLALVENFRIAAAVTKPYKGQRKTAKPTHYANIIAYMIDRYEVKVSCGMEADDLICMDQMSAEPFTTTICTRDKDLRMVEGWHFGWTCANQQQYGPTKIDYVGSIALHNKKLSGTGKAFFYSQLITGDSVDNIPGLPGCGPALAFKTLSGMTTEGEMLRAVTGLYKDKLGSVWEEYMLEQGTLLWMIYEEGLTWEKHWQSLK